MKVAAFAELSVPSELRRQARAIREQAWPSAPGDAILPAGHDPALQPLTMLLLDKDDTVLAVLDILRKPLRHAGGLYAAAGLSAVATREDLRGRGHGRRLVTAAHHAMAQELNLDIGIFTCDRPLRRLYERAGWEHLPGTVLVGGTPAEPFPSDQPGFDKTTLAAFFSPIARRARRSFEAARIELYPGEIDRLW